VVVWEDGSTIAFREELLPIRESLQPMGLPPFGALVLLLAGLRGKTPAAAQLQEPPAVPAVGPVSGKAVALLAVREQFRRQLEAACAELKKLTQLPAELRSGLAGKCVLAEALLERFTGARTPAGPILRGWAEPIPDAELNESGVDDGPGGSGEGVQHVHLLAQGLKEHSPASLALRLRTGLDALPGKAETPLPPAERARRLIDALSQDPEQGAMARAALRFLAAVRLPRHLGERDELAVGGVADITNRGPLDRLLLSELAHDDLTLAVRVALNEALFLRREPPAHEPPGTLALLLDSGVRLWGVPRVLAGAVALALAASDRQLAQVLAWRAHGAAVRSIDLLSRAGLIEHLAALAVDAHPGAALTAFVAALPPATHHRTVVITHPDGLMDPDFRRALAQLNEHPGFVATVDRSGRFELHRLPLAHRPPLCQAEIDLAAVFQEAKKPLPLLDSSRPPDLPAFLRMVPCPFLLPYPGAVDHWVKTPDGRIFASLTDRQLITFEGRRTGGQTLTGRLPPGRTVWMGVADGEVHLLKAAGLRRPIRLVSVPAAGGEPRVTDLLSGVEWVAAHATEGVLLLIRTHKIRAFALSDGRALGGTVHPHRWLHGRYFASQDSFYAATWDGQAVRLDPVTLAPAYNPQSVRLLFDRDGLAGPWMLLKQSGLVLSSADGKRAACNISTTDADTVMVSDDGHRVLLTRRYPPMRSLSFLESGVVRNDRGGPVREEELNPPPSLPSWNLYRVSTGAISASAADGLSLCGRKGRWRDVRWHAADGALRMFEAAPDVERVRHCLVFSRCSAPPALGCTLEVASWLNGSQAFLDSRGLLHLKSHDSTVPELTLALCVSELAGWTSDGDVCGPRFFIGDAVPAAKKVHDALVSFLERL
jgi:hypothetical protein